ncbi:unnamed protein product, partial [marine sediment metagenome]
MINWYYYPKTDKIPEHLRKTLNVFEAHKDEIKEDENPDERLSSNKVLGIV